MAEKHTVDYAALRRAILADSGRRHKILEQSDTDILTDDAIEGRHINYHLISPTAKWLASRFVWAPSIEGSTDAWTRRFSELLLKADPQMFVCLNRIIFLSDDENDIPAISGELGVAPDDVPCCAGCMSYFWLEASSIIINLSAIEDILRGMLIDREITRSELEDKREEEIAGSLLMCLHLLALHGNPYFPDGQRSYAESSASRVPLRAAAPHAGSRSDKDSPISEDAIVSMLMISTAHISEETAEVMEGEGFENLATYAKGQFGFFVPVPATSMLYEGSNYQAELPEDLCACLKYAAEQGCCWLMLDRDYETVSGLPTYDW